MRLLDKYPVLLLDMCGTFMFGEDRFGAEEDFHATYRSLGGSRLSAGAVSQCVRQCFAGMSRDYADPARYDDFPTLTEGFRRYAQPPEDELPLLERVFAMHECGTIPDSCASLLRRVARTHQIGLVSNIWAPKQVYMEEFERAGIHGVFRHTIFSSDFRSIKPSPVLFREALRGAAAQPGEVLFIGDSLRCDMEGARRAGLATAWITSQPERPGCVDWVIASIHEIETHEV